jgi:hypothetical protein
VPSGLNRAQWLRPSAVSNRAFRVAATNIITIIIIVVVVEATMLITKINNTISRQNHLENIGSVIHHFLIARRCMFLCFVVVRCSFFTC